MPNEAPTAETADVDFAALLRNEQAGLQAQLKELGFADQGSGLNYDSNFADSSQVTAERGEAERLATELRETLDEVEAALARLEAGTYGLCEVCGKPIGDGPPRGHAGGPPLHRRRRQALGAPARSPLGEAPDGSADQARPVDHSRLVVFVVALIVHHNITETEIIIFCVMVPSIILHEVSHGYVANAFGDDTAKRAGPPDPQPGPPRGPRRHADRPRPARRWAAVGFFGWAKPVPVNVGGCAARATRACWCRWPARRSTPPWPRSSAVLFVQFVTAQRARPRGDFSTGAQIVFYASLVNVGLCASST